MQQSLRYKWGGLVSPPTTPTYLCNRCRHKSKERTKKISSTGATFWRQRHHFVWPYKRVYVDPGEGVLKRVWLRRSPVVAAKESAQFSLVLGHVYSLVAMFSHWLLGLVLLLILLRNGKDNKMPSGCANVEPFYVICTVFTSVCQGENRIWPDTETSPIRHKTE